MTRYKKHGRYGNYMDVLALDLLFNTWVSSGLVVMFTNGCNSYSWYRSYGYNHGQDGYGYGHTGYGYG